MQQKRLSKYFLPATPTALEQNPFAILEATTRDDRQRIVELADVKSLSIDPDLCAQARETLNNPRKRVAPEIAWLPGLSPRQAADALAQLRDNPSILLEPGEDFAMARANLVASALELLSTDLTVEEWSAWLAKLTELSDVIQVDDLMRDLNEDRTISRFPEITSLDVVEEEVAYRKKYYREAIINALDRLPSLKLVDVAAHVVNASTQGGSEHGPALVHEAIDSYETKAGSYLRKEADTLLALVTAALEVAPKGEGAVAAYLDRIEEILQRWGRVAKPIQTSKKSRGLEHDISVELARTLRSLTIKLVNEHDMLGLSDRILKTLKASFVELPEFVHKLESNSETLTDLLEQRERHGEELEAWNREIAFSCDIGTIFKKRLSITAEKIRWGDEVYLISSISRIRWGATRHSVNGVPTGTSYNISFGSDVRGSSLQTNKFVYEEFTQRLWKTVGTRLAAQMVEDLKKGARLRFGTATIHDAGVDFVSNGFFSGTQTFATKWSDVRISNGNGCFMLGIEHPKRVQTALSYQDDDNVHSLEVVIRFLFKSGAGKISDAFR